MECEVDFSNYRVVVLTNNKEIIIKNIVSVNDSPGLVCDGIFTSNNFGNNWVGMAINRANIIYTRELFDSEKRIIRRVEGEN